MSPLRFIGFVLLLLVSGSVWLQAEYLFSVSSPSRRQTKTIQQPSEEDLYVESLVLGVDLPPLLPESMRGAHYYYDITHLRWALWMAASWTHEPNKDFTVCETPSDLKLLVNELISEYVRIDKDKWDTWEFANGTHIPCQLTNTSLDRSVSIIHCPGKKKMKLCGPSIYNLGRQPSMHYDDIFTSMKFLKMIERYRTPQTSWDLSITDESIVYYPQAADPERLSHMNFTVGYDSDIFDIHVFPFASKTYNILQKPPAIMPFKERNPVPVVFINSNCETHSNRTPIMEELMKHVKVDSYGQCLHNKEFPPFNGSDFHVQKRSVIHGYKFTISIENSISHDYITEKLWEPLIEGSVPIYLGSPNVENYAPPHSLLHMRNFTSLQKLGEYINYLASNEEEYMKLQDWRKGWVNKKLERRVKQTRKLPRHACITRELIDTGFVSKDFLGS